MTSILSLFSHSPLNVHGKIKTPSNMKKWLKCRLKWLKCRLLTQMAECEFSFYHMDKACPMYKVGLIISLKIALESQPFTTFKALRTAPGHSKRTVMSAVVTIIIKGEVNIKSSYL